MSNTYKITVYVFGTSGQLLSKLRGLASLRESLGRYMVTNGEIFGASQQPDGSYNADGFDQISWLVNEINTNPNSRRLIVSGWNPKRRIRWHCRHVIPCFSFLWQMASYLVSCINVRRIYFRYHLILPATPCLPT